MKIGINGFGRIGKTFLRSLLARHPALEVVAINDLQPPAALAHALAYDTAYGRYGGPLEAHSDRLVVAGRTLYCSAEREPGRIPWAAHGAELIVDCSGRHTDGALARAHLGPHAARKVIVSAPMQHEDLTLVMGINEAAYDPARHHVLSNASCTTNALACVVGPLSAAFGWQHGVMTTTHAYTNDQNVLDAPHKDPRRARAAAQNLVPTSSGAAKALHLVLPATQGRFDGFAIRVPIASVSMVTLVAQLGRPVGAAEANEALVAAASAGPLAGKLAVSAAPLVSQDFRGDPHSAIVDLPLTQSVGPLLQVSAWYDNEWGYACRLGDLAAHVAAAG